MIAKYISHWLICLLPAIALVACSDANPDAPNETSIHAATWSVEHSLEADLTACTVCHGSDYRGGGAAVSCFSCHFEDNPPQFPPSFLVHPATWADTYVDHRAFVTANGFQSCANAACHGTSPFVRGGAAAPSCGSADFTNGNGTTHSCHAIHITGASWLLPAGHAASAIANVSGCWACHDPNLQLGGNPACSDCHTVKQPNYAQGTCNSCHGTPPSSGRHSKHSGIGSCTTCHVNYGTNTLGHYYPNPAPPADVAFNFAGDPNIQAGFNYSGGRCSGTCHGESHNSDSW